MKKEMLIVKKTLILGLGFGKKISWDLGLGPPPHKKTLILQSVDEPLGRSKFYFCFPSEGTGGLNKDL